MKNLHTAKRILLIRMENGWYMRDEESKFRTDPKWVFESTESLAAQLVPLLGQSGWNIAIPKQTRQMPDRNEKGHFLPKSIDSIPAAS